MKMVRDFEESVESVKHQALTTEAVVCAKEYRDLLIVLPMREPSIFRGIAVSLLRPVIGSNVEIDVVALNWVADVRKQIAAAFK